MNRRELGFGVASASLALSAGNHAFAQSEGASAPVPEQLQAQIGRLPQAIQADVRKVYEQTGGRPIWNEQNLRALQEVAGRSDRHAIHAGDYFDFVGLAADKQSAEVKATASALSYAKILAHGRVKPEDVEELWEMQKNSVDVAQGLVDAVRGNKLSDWFDGLPPQDIGYTNLSAGYIRYRRIARDGGWPAFAQGAQIEPGSSDPRVPALVKRLAAEGDMSAAAANAHGSSTVYSEAVQRAVRSFQARHGLGVDGRVGPATQRSLGASAEDRARQIALNLERRRWLKRELQSERIEVNTAAAIMVYWKDNQPVHSNRVVVGSLENQTPSLERPFASVVANPPWTVPMGIARREILPKGPGYLAANDMYINDNGWVVQRAGPKSSLGYVKFELRDSYAIFLHDTPNKGAFNLSMRQRSHGCVRVHNAVEFARLLLSPDPTKLAAFDTAQADRSTTRVQTGRPIGVRLLYWTAFVDGQGRVAFREDSYRRDAKLARAMGIDVNLPTVVSEAPKDKDDDWI
ncbi:MULTISPECIES: L,D-transpeptidase family protein [unclassified Brevundimonas]|uniref:L,D-transpeptidase family protein n=1 Tax=unclassified Brevundimonas TaxID=2622653 RepID=UPI0025C33EE6|nr:MULTISPECIES: L,D-transpeptidase family protein [unclassified Brevundimonas]